MSLGENLSHARRKRGLSQEAAAEKLGVSRQTISKWETDETLPDIRQAKQLSVLYGLSLDELIDFDIEVQELQEVIRRTSQELSDKVDWAKLWSGKYPILARYRQEVEVSFYAAELRQLLDHLKEWHSYSELDAFLVLKDILAEVWKEGKKNR